MSRARDVAIVGAGLAGPLLAVLLRQRGFDVTLYERRPDPRAGGGARSRSINLAISARGIDALGRAGLSSVLESAVPMRGRMIHGPHGELHFQPYGHAGQAINSVSRAALNAALVEAAERAGARVEFDRHCVGLDIDPPRLTFRDDATGATREVAADAIVGADGAHSAVRRRLERTDRFAFRQDWLEHGYKELTIPALPGGRFAMEPNALHIWPRGGFMTIALPNGDGSFTCTCFWPFSGPAGFDALRTPDDVVRYFADVFPDAVPLMPSLADDYLGNPTGSLVTIRCAPWHRGAVGLLGDAAHAVVPFYGQGANASFEDCTVLAECLDATADDWSRAFALYEARRRVHTDALAELALDNFVEMRDRTASRAFLWRKKLEHGLAAALPGTFRPLYEMVTFSRTPYADAVRRARTQWRVVGAAAAALAGLVVAGGALARARRRT